MNNYVASDDDPKGVNALPLPDTLPSDDKFYGYEMLRLVAVLASYSDEPIQTFHVERSDAPDLPESWGSILANAAFVIAQDYFDGDLTELRSGSVIALSGPRGILIAPVPA